MSIDHEQLNIFQITDTHLFRDDNTLMYDVNTHKNFHAVLEKIRNYRDIKPHFFILTGDLSQDESEESYIKIMDAMKSFHLPVYWIPGNHDDPEKMEYVFHQSSLFSKLRRLELKNWDLIFLNTKMNGTDKGFLSQQELCALEEELKKSVGHKQIAIIMHHHPVKVNTPLIDKYILTNSNDFWSIIHKHSHIKLIICGHVHGNYRLKYHHINIECSPATCLQWKIGASKLEIEKNIGFKIYRLFEKEYSCFVKSWSFI